MFLWNASSLSYLMTTFLTYQFTSQVKVRTYGKSIRLTANLDRTGGNYSVLQQLGTGTLKVYIESNGLFMCSDRERDDDPTVTIKNKESYTRQFAAVEKGTTGWV